MIDYATLCTAIDNWKAGAQPSAAPPAAPRRVSAPAAAPGEEEDAVEYSAVYDTSEARPEEPVDSTVIYQLPEGEEYEEGEEGDEGEAAVEADADETEVETEIDDEERR